ncbi:hypothetical protein [Brevibacillus centrosporus]|uniref:hypothetical protein n=1 Tax=Brevibacillus centrosporus TaxID=54910 RepID=UPI002E1F9E57|nr:hypothetical protein [Brevibacillus centrosporus]
MKIDDCDGDFPDGVYAVPRTPGEPRVKVRKLSEYCRVKGIKPSDLSKEEMEQFLVIEEQEKARGYEKGGETMITYNIDISNELKNEIEQVIEEHLREIVDGEQFTVLHANKAIIGQRSGNVVTVEQIVEKVL